MSITTRTALAAALQLLFLHAAVAAGPGDGRVVRDEPYRLPPFEEAGVDDFVATREEYERAAGDAAFELRELTYESGGLEVSAFLYRPRDAGARRYPVVVYNRGSYLVGRDLGPKLAPMFHRLATAGFVVVAPLYRESNGAAGRDEVGGADLQDLMSVAPLVARLPYADARNVFLYGESRGGMMVLQALRDGFPANAAATFGAFTDLDAYVREAGPQLEALSRKIWPEWETRRADVVRRRSAIYWADRLKAPLLVMHGGADRSVDPSHARALARLLEKAGATHELAIFEGDNHVLSANRVERDRRAAAWFRRFMR